MPGTLMTHASRPGPIAPVSHTLLLVAIFVAIGVGGGFARQSGAVANPSKSFVVPLYLSVLASEWVLVWVVSRGIKGSGVTLRDLIGGRWAGVGAVVRDVALAAAVWVVWLVIQAAIRGPGGAGGLLPDTPTERAVWVVLALSAGFCEELVFRGYLQRQFAALTGSAFAGIVLQGIVFGFGHLYEGTIAVARIVCFGFLFGALAQWRRSLRPGMLAHGWSDLTGALFHR